MWVEDGKLDGNVAVRDAFQLNGMVTGSISVAPAGRLWLNGMCCGNLVVEAGAEVELRGACHGDILNKGGLLSVYGTVQGGILTSAGGQTRIDESAVVRGIVRREAGPQGQH